MADMTPALCNVQQRWCSNVVQDTWLGEFQVKKDHLEVDKQLGILGSDVPYLHHFWPWTYLRTEGHKVFSTCI